VPDLLRFVWERADSTEPVYSADEVALWPLAALDWLSSRGLLRAVANASAIACDACGTDHVEEVIVQKSPPGSGVRAYIPCPDAGRVPVPLDRLRRWGIDFPQVAKVAASALAAGGGIEELVPSRLWLLGKTTLAGRRHEVFLARGLPWQDGAEVVGNAARLLASPRPVLLVPGSVPPSDIWQGEFRPVLPLSALLSWGDGGPVIDRAHLEAAAATGRGRMSPTEAPAAPPEAKDGSDETANGKRTRMTVEAANKTAMGLARRMKQAFFLLSEREQARQIGCSWTTWARTKFYATVRKKRGRLGRQGAKGKGPVSRPAVSFTGALEAVLGDGEPDEVLNRLIDGERQPTGKERKWEDLSPAEQQELLADQEADYEPSSLDDDPPGSRPKRVRTRKRS
jgi:hypothetical protein